MSQKETQSASRSASPSAQGVTKRTAVKKVDADEKRSIQNPVEIARDVAVANVEDPSAVGDFVCRIDVGGGVYDFRFASHLPGYDGWQWAVSMFHDVPVDEWTVDECALLPTSGSLVAPAWVPFRQRLQPGDVQSTDRLGTDVDDSRLEQGVDEDSDQENDLEKSEDYRQAVGQFRLTRKRVLTRPALQQIAQRWYDGSHGPKSLSTAAADGYHCQSCAFFIPLAGSMGRMFGVCANKWSPDDGKVVSVDHGCGEHSQIKPPVQTGLWPANDPVYDDSTIEIVAPRNRDEPNHARVVENLDNSLSSEDDSSQQESSSDDDESQESLSVTVNSSDVQAQSDRYSEKDVTLDRHSTDPRVAQEISSGFTRRRVRRRRHPQQ
jgi:hypothetical protein